MIIDLKKFRHYSKHGADTNQNLLVRLQRQQEHYLREGKAAKSKAVAARGGGSRGYDDLPEGDPYQEEIGRLEATIKKF